METALQKIEPESAHAIQLAQPDISEKMYEVARKLEHATGIDQNELGKMTLITFETFLKIEEVLEIRSNANRKTAFPTTEMRHMAFKVSVFQPAIIADREKLASLLATLDGILAKLPG
jgi:hypothetical protein